jgi:hypothetical protein
MERTWLEEKAHQKLVYQICSRTIVEIAPEETPIFEEIFPAYIRAAQAGEVSFEPSEAEEAFAFNGIGINELLTLVLIPFVINIISSLLVAQIEARRSDIRRSNSNEPLPIDITELREKLQAMLEKEETIPDEARSTIIDVTIDCLTDLYDD